MARLIPDEFVPLHVHYRRDRAIRNAGPEAELLFIRALAFARANRTDGTIEDFDLDEIGAGLNDPSASAATLVKVNLWITSGTGWLIRSFEKWNPASASESGTFGNHKRWHLDRGLVAPNCPHCPSESSPDDPPTIAPESPRSSPRVGGDIAPMSGGIAEERRREERREDTSSSELRPDVADLLDHLDRCIIANGAKKPNRTKGNQDAARLLLDRDGRDPEEVHRIIDWATSDDFWRSNILSMVKLREKYDQLRIKSGQGVRVNQTFRVVGGTEWE